MQVDTYSDPRYVLFLTELDMQSKEATVVRCTAANLEQENAIRAITAVYTAKAHTILRMLELDLDTNTLIAVAMAAQAVIGPKEIAHLPDVETAKSYPLPEMKRVLNGIRGAFSPVLL